MVLQYKTHKKYEKMLILNFTDYLKIFDLDITYCVN